MVDTGSAEKLGSGYRALRLDPGGLGIDLDEMARRPLPGGIAAAAIAAAMGVALVAKALRVALRRQGPDGPGQAEMEEWVGRAARKIAELLDLVGADTVGYRSVLDTRAMADHEPARQEAWQAATEVPLRLAELSIPLEMSVPAFYDCCPPQVHLDLRIGACLLHTAGDGGRWVAEENLEKCGESDQAGMLRLRLAALKEAQLD